MPKKLEGKVAVITGGTENIGFDRCRANGGSPSSPTEGLKIDRVPR